MLEAYLDFLDEITNCSDSLWRSLRNTCRDDVHVDLTSLRISSTLLHSGTNKPDSFCNILLFNSLWKSHSGNGLWDPDQWLKLSWRSSDSLLFDAHWPHIFVLLNKDWYYFRWNCRAHVLSRIWDVFGKELTTDVISHNQVCWCDIWIVTFSLILIEVGHRIEWNDVVSKATIYNLRLFIQNEINHVESGK